MLIDMTTRHEPEETQARRSLWRDGNFLTFWGGQTLAQAGTQITELAIPVLAVVLLNATELQVGFLNAAAVAAFLVVGLPAGAWIDRMRKRRVMITADLVRAVALSLLPLLWWLDVLAMWHLYAVALVLGIATVFDVSYQSVIPSLVPGRQIAEANGKLEATRELANIGEQYVLARLSFSYVLLYCPCRKRGKSEETFPSGPGVSKDGIYTHDPRAAPRSRR